MVIEFRPGIFNNDFKSFNHLFQICTHRNRYEIYADYISIKDSENFKRLDVTDKELLALSFDAQMTKQSSKKIKGRAVSNADYYVDSNATNENNVFGIEEALAFFNQKVAIILENSHHDAYFIKALIKYFDSNGKLRAHLANNWITFDNAGGCTNVENHIAEKLLEFNELPKDNKYYYRAFVLLDSDRKSPQELIDQKHKKLLKFLIDNNVVFHILEKRMMENYMPEDVIKDYSDVNTKDWINAYAYLTKRQKDFIDFTKGFSKKDHEGAPLKSRTELDQSVQELFASVSNTNFTILDIGFKLSHFKNKFPANFIENGKVNATSLKEMINHQDNPDEYKDIIDKIAKLL
ncbi:hypothetical protein D3C87_395050 [compost metagenome]